MQVINKIRGLGRRRPICLVTSMITVQIELDDMMFCFNNNINHTFNKVKHKMFQEFKCAGAVALLHVRIVILSNLIVGYCFLLVLR